MARPIKNNADYFSHDADMRNDLRIKALRRKFGHIGFSIYNMLLEVLSDSDYFKYELTDLNIELLSGDFDLDIQELNDILEYLINLGLMQRDGTYLTCKTLENRFESMLSKRKRDRKGVIVDDNTQSKEKESKEDNYFNQETFLEWFNECRIYIKLPSNIKKLSRVEQQLFSELKTTYTIEDFKTAIKGFSNDSYFVSNNMLFPIHFLKEENFTKFLNAKVLTLGQQLAKLN